jgi:hypothetical protein
MYFMCVHNSMFKAATATRVFTYSRIFRIRILLLPAGTTQHTYITVVTPAPFSPRAGDRCINLLPTTAAHG